MISITVSAPERWHTEYTRMPSPVYQYVINRIVSLPIRTAPGLRMNISVWEHTEYARILFMSLLFCIIFLGSDLYSFLFYFKLTFISFLFVRVRGTMPRFRYDKLMYLAWKRFLPLSLIYLLFFVGVRCFVFSLL